MPDIFLHFDTSFLDAGYLKPLLALLLVCLLILPTLERLRVSPVLGYLLAGLVLGSSGLHLVQESEALEDLADLGVVFLLFIIGLNISWGHLIQMRRHVLQMGLLQVFITGIVASAVAWHWDHSLPVTILLGLGFALSSTAIVSQHLIETDTLHTPKGRLAMAVLLAQDLVVVPLLVMVKVFTEESAGSLGGALALTFIKAIAAIAIVMLLGRYVLRPLYRLLHKHSRLPETRIALSLLAIFTAAAVTSMAGLSMELGAFLAGLILAGSRFRERIQKDIQPFQGLLLGLFFITVGMQINVVAVMENLGWLVLSVAGLLVLKTVVILLLGRMLRLPAATTLPTAFLLGQGSEFVFVIVGVATEAGLMPKDVGQFMLLVTAVSMLATPVYTQLSVWAEKRLPRKVSP